VLEPWFVPFALTNGAAVGLAPILFPIVAERHGLGHVGLVMGAFNLGAFAAPLVGSVADRFRNYRSLAAGCAGFSAASLWLFPLAGPPLQLLLALANGGGFAGAVTVANLLTVEQHPRQEWNQRFGWLETVLSVGRGGALILAAWLSGLSARTGLQYAALVPALAIPLSALLIPRIAAPAAPEPPGQAAHRLASVGHVGEWGPASPSRVHHLRHRRHPLAGLSGVLHSGFGWMLAAWLPAYAGSAIVFSLSRCCSSTRSGWPRRPRRSRSR
jgi:MFS family permease